MYAEQFMQDNRIMAIKMQYDDTKGVDFDIDYPKAYDQAVAKIGEADEQALLNLVISILEDWLTQQSKKPAKNGWGRFWRAFFTAIGFIKS